MTATSMDVRTRAGTDAYQRWVNPYLGQLLAALKLDVRYVSGQGSWLTDANGRRYLDFVCGYGAVAFGHQPKCAERGLRRYLQQHAPALVQPSSLDAAGRLAERLSAIAPPGLDMVCFTNSGAEAVEAALKACRAATGKPGVVHADGSFHGKTLAALSATGSVRYQRPFQAPLENFHAVPYGDVDALAASLAARADTVGCVILEPLQGEGGIVVPPPGYLTAVRELCTRHRVLLVLDEVQSGLGRTGSWFACEEEGVVPDVMTLSKALGAGVVPIGCALLGPAARTRDFGLLHSSTYAGNSLACEVALEVLAELDDPALDILGNVARRSTQLLAGLQELKARYPEIVRSVRGRGLMLGLELSYDDRWASPAPAAVLRVADEQGHLMPLVSAYLLHVEGVRTAPALSAGRVLRIEPALTVCADECAHFLQALERVLRLLASCDAGTLLAPLVDDAPAAARAMAEVPATRPINVDPEPGDARVAFLVHSVEPRYTVALDSSLRPLGEDRVRAAVDLVAGLSEPFVLSRTRVVSAGAAVHLEFICVPHYAQALLAMEPAESQAVVGQAIRLAATRGARLVGLGGMTSIVTAGGTLATQHGVAVTTGNTFTVLSALDALGEALTLRGRSLADVRMAIVGAAGMIGGTLIGHYLGRVRQLVLVGNPAKPTTTRRRLVHHLDAAFDQAPPAWRDDIGAAGLAAPARVALAERIVAGELSDRCGVTCPLDVAAALACCDVIVCAASATEHILDVRTIAPGAVVLDLSRPHVVDVEAARRRPEVLFIEGGLVGFPGAPQLGVDIGAPPGQGLACMAETVMLGLGGHFEHASIGARADLQTQHRMRSLAGRFGFTSGSLRSFNRTLERDDMLTAAPADRRAPLLAHRAAPALHVVDAASPVNLASALLHSHRHLADVPALVDATSGLAIGYPALWLRVACTARRLRAWPIAPGDTVAFCAADSIALACGILACWWVGAVAAPLNPGLAQADRTHMLRTLGPAAVLVDEAHARLGAEVRAAGWPCGSLEQLCEDEPQWHATLAHDPQSQPLQLPASTRAVYLFSSGSSGTPKAFAHTHGDFLTVHANYLPAVVGLAAGERVFSPSRMHFAYGLLAVTFALFAGGTAVLAPQPSKTLNLVELLVRHRPNVVFAVPTTLKFICSQWQPGDACPALRLVVSAGEMLPGSLHATVRRLLGVEVLDGIGCTEVLSTYISNRRGTSRPDCTGEVVPGFEVRLLDEQGAVCPAGEPGVLWVRGGTLAHEVHGDPAQTQRVFQGGWFNTNDVVVMHGDGSFQHLGRANDVLKINGCWVAPTRIEEVLTAHPAVDECAVVTTQDEHGLVRPKAVVVLNAAAAESPGLWLELKARCREHLGEHQYPHFFETRISLPRTANGKLQRGLLR